MKQTTKGVVIYERKNRSYKQQILKSKNNEFFWHLSSKNGNILIWSGESYQTIQSCLKGLNSTFKGMSSLGTLLKSDMGAL